MPRIITIDGPAGSGKSTVATLVAAALNGIPLDSGSFYRIVSNELLFAGIDHADEEAVMDYIRSLTIEAEQGVAEKIGGRLVPYQCLKTPAVQAIVSATSRHPSLRDFINAELRRYVSAVDCDVVCEGRDAGHVILPNADFMLYLDAPTEVRAERTNESLEQVLARDLSDKTTKGEGNLLSRDEAHSRGYYIINAAEPLEDVVTYCIEAITGGLL